MGIETIFLNFIFENYLFTGDQPVLSNKDSFPDKGNIDSTGTLELIFFLEEEFTIAVEAEEMSPENLDSVMIVNKFVESMV